jgi:hypothetical protein
MFQRFARFPRNRTDKRAWIFEPHLGLSDSPKLFDTDAQLIENSVEQWLTDVSPAVDRYGHSSPVGVNPSFVTSRLTAQFKS